MTISARHDRQVGLIGIGLLGTAIAERLLADGFHVIGFDLLESRREALRSCGGEPVASADDVFAGCDRVVLSLPDSHVSADLLGAARSLLRAGHLLIDTTTGSPDDAERFAADLSEVGASYVECTIAGSSEQVRRHEAVAMLGGRSDDIERARPVVGAIARESHVVGQAGDAARMKLVVNLAIGLHRAVLAEALALARAAGLDGPQTLDVLKSGPAASRAMETKGEKMLTGDFAPQARLAQHRKDVELILELAARCGAHTPLTAAHRELLDEAIRRGFADADNSAIIRAFE